MTWGSMCDLTRQYRDELFMKKDVILKLTEHGELTQTSLLSYCNLNLMKHRDMLESLESKGFIKRIEKPWGKKKIIKYSVTDKGQEFFKNVLGPYEETFPRQENHDILNPTSDRIESE